MLTSTPSTCTCSLFIPQYDLYFLFLLLVGHPLARLQVHHGPIIFWSVGYIYLVCMYCTPGYVLPACSPCDDIICCPGSQKGRGIPLGLLHDPFTFDYGAKRDVLRMCTVCTMTVHR